MNEPDDVWLQYIVIFSVVKESFTLNKPDKYAIVDKKRTRHALNEGHMTERTKTDDLPCRVSGLCRLFCAVLILSASLVPPDTLFAGGSTPHVREAVVLRVNDGDTVTLRMSGKTYRTRLIGIDAPELGQEPWGEKAKAHLRDILKETGWTVSVETDTTEYDKYDRLLVYLRSNDGRLINERMVLDGYAVTFTIRPNTKYADRFRKAQHVARGKRTAIWGTDAMKERPFRYRLSHPRL
jgi:micrococcal nuclease